MKFNLCKLITLFAAFVINFTMINMANAENIKKSQSKKAQNTTSVNGEGLTWKEEPTSFFGINFAQPLTNSIPSACPTKFEYGVSEIDFKAVGAQPCYFQKDSGGNAPKITVVVRGIAPLPELMTVKTDTGRIDGNVVFIQMLGFKEEYYNIFQALINKYGNPHEQALTPTISVNGGTNQIESIWRGKSVILYTTSDNGTGVIVRAYLRK